MSAVDTSHLTRQFPIWILFLVTITLAYSDANCQSLNAGIRIQKTQYMYWENGITVQYSSQKLKPERLYFGFDYISSRFGTAFHSNAIKQDNFLISGTWLFNPNKPYHFYSRLNLGYFYSDLEFEMFDEVPNTAFLFSPEIGLRYNPINMPISFNLGTGYYLFTSKDGYSPGTLQPLYFHLDFSYFILKSSNNE